MSFLLRKPRGVPATRVPPPGGHRDAGSRGKSAAAVQASLRGGAGGGQQQLLLQRQPAQLTHKTMQSSKQKTQQASTGTQKELQSVLTMEEVHADLLVLEQQQRDSHRKLEAIKLTKQHKLEQRSALESKLSSLKYANGEQRAQLVRARDVLSRCTRELGAAKLRSGRSSEALRAFDGRLKRALASARSLQVMRRKLDSGIIVLRNKEANILRLKSQITDSLKAAEKSRDETKLQEQSLRKAIHDEKVKAEHLIEQTTSIRSDVSGLEQDLAAAEQMAASTKLRAETIASEIDSEGRRHDHKMQAMCSKIGACEKKEAEITKYTKAVKEQIDLKMAQIYEAWRRCQQLQLEEGHELCPEPSDDGPAITIDVALLRAKLEGEREALRLEKAARDSLAESVVQGNEKLTNLTSSLTAAKELAASILQAAEEAQNVEKGRREANEKFLAELERERSKVSDLRRSVSDLMDSNGMEKKRLEDKVSEQALVIQKRQVEVEEMKAHLVSEGKSIQELEASAENEKKEKAQLLEAAKQEADSMRAEFEDVRREVEALEYASDSDIEKEVEEIKQAQSILVEDTKDEIARLFEEYPALAAIEFTYDPDKTVEDHAREALFNLRADCKAQIQKAQAEKEANRKARKRTQEREAEALRKKKEERRKERIRRKTEKQEEEALLDDTTNLDEEIEDWQDFNHDSVPEAAEEPLVVSQKRIRFEDDEVLSPVAMEESSSRVRQEKRTYGRSRTYRGQESSGSGQTKSKKDDRKELASSLKGSGRTQSTSKDGNDARARHPSSKSLTKHSTSSESTSKRKSCPPAQETRPSKSPKLENSKSWTSIESSSRAASRSPKPENCPFKRSKHMDMAPDRSSKSRTSTDSLSKPTNRTPVLETRPTKKPKHADINSSATNHASSSRFDPSIESKSRVSSKLSGSLRKDVSWEDSCGTLAKKRPAPSHLSTNSAGRDSKESKRDDARLVTSQKCSSNRSQKTSNKSVSSSREVDVASQASGIATVERAPKSRRRKKPTTGKAKAASLSSLGALQDDDFRF